jgi:hypothetical protein
MSIFVNWRVVSGALVELVHAGMRLSMGLFVLVFLGFLVLMLFVLVENWLMDVDFVEVVLVEMLGLQMLVVEMDFVEVVLVDDMLMLVVFVDHLLRLVVLVNDFLGLVGMGLVVLDGMVGLDHVGMAVVFLHGGGALGVRVLTVDNSNGTVGGGTVGCSRGTIGCRWGTVSHRSAIC